jgi:hypothetical protein
MGLSIWITSIYFYDFHFHINFKKLFYALRNRVYMHELFKYLNKFFMKITNLSRIKKKRLSSKTMCVHFLSLNEHSIFHHFFLLLFAFIPFMNIKYWHNILCLMNRKFNFLRHNVATSFNSKTFSLSPPIHLYIGYDYTRFYRIKKKLW